MNFPNTTNDNTTNNQPDPDYQRMIQLLADGELPDGERLGLLEQCEQQPALWRQVALSLLEAQLLRCHLQGIVADVAGSEPGAVRGSPGAVRGYPGAVRGSPGAVRGYPDPAPPPPRRFAVVLAATVLVSLFVGYQAGRFLSAERPNPLVATTTSDNVRTSQSAPLVARDQPDIPRVSPTPQTLSLLVSDPYENALEQIEVPMMTWAEAHENWLAEQPDLPEPLRQLVERSPSQVAGQRWLIPFKLHDGRPGMIPVDVLQVNLTDYQ